jgi:acyl transferase domain-containing protein
MQELELKLNAFLRSDDTLDPLSHDEVYRGEVRHNKETLNLFASDQTIRAAVTAWLETGRYDKALGAWVKGFPMDWNQLYPVGKPVQVSLPTYPFARSILWSLPEQASRIAKGAAKLRASQLHPLLHTNISDLHEARYTTRLEGTEFYLRDHVVDGKRLLPAVAYLEMARAAVALAVGAHQATGSSIQLGDCLWLHGLPVEQAVELQIGLRAAPGCVAQYEISSADRDGKRLVHAQGDARFITGDSPMLDIDKLRRACTQEHPSDHWYSSFARMNVHYGSALRGLQGLWSGVTEGRRFVLGEVKLPREAAQTLGEYVLHPAVLDSALQASVGLLSSTDAEVIGDALLPFSLQELTVHGRSTNPSWVHVVESDHSTPLLRRLDICVSDQDGNVWAILKGLGLRGQRKHKNEVSRTSGRTSAMMLMPVWESASLARGPQSDQRTQSVLIVGGTDLQHQALRNRFGKFQMLDPKDNQIATALASAAPVDQIVWYVPAAREIDAASEELIEKQEDGVMTGFALLKALLRAGYDSRELALTVITEQSVAVLHGEPIAPAHASVHGFIGSVAKEFDHWNVRLVDLSSQQSVSWDQLLDVPADGESWAFRLGDWYRQELLPCEPGEATQPLYRRNGVYVVVGGAGGIGEAFSEHLIREYDAKIIWIGRRVRDEKIRSQQERLGRLGRAPTYIQADATRRDELATACEQILREHGVIHGVVHAAIVLRDRGLLNMEELEFREVLMTKVAVSVRIAQVFARAKLDFLLFFSSLQSFARMPGQSNYAAGCTFKDAHALQLASTLPCAVKIMNWGYWGSRGVVASDFYRERMAAKQVESIEAADGMAALDRLLGGPCAQLGYVHLDQMAESRIRVSTRVSMNEADAPSLIGSLAVSEEVVA